MNDSLPAGQDLLGGRVVSHPKESHRVRHACADVGIVGGAGHVGLPLALLLASKGKRVFIYDTNSEAVALIGQGKMPFLEYGAEPLLRQALERGLLSLGSAPDGAKLEGIPTLIITLGTPIDEFLNPTMKTFVSALEPLISYLSSDPLVILRSTVYPGTTQWLDRYLRLKGTSPKLAFCPERIVQGHAIEELPRLPQIIGATSSEAEVLASKFFRQIVPDIVFLPPMEAELAKLTCNAYRYIQFAAANQFFTIANSLGLDYHRMLEGMKRGYGRMRDLPGPGFSAGPCLFKDTMQLVALCNNGFSLGNTAMLINEGLPLYLVNQLARKHDLPHLAIGLLGMAFKAESDDARASLSYKLKKVLRFSARAVLTTDPFIQGDPELLPATEVVARSDILILCVPHEIYRGLDLQGKVVVDVWNFFGHGGVV